MPKATVNVPESALRSRLNHYRKAKADAKARGDEAAEKWWAAKEEVIIDLLTTFTLLETAK